MKTYRNAKSPTHFLGISSEEQPDQLRGDQEWSLWVHRCTLLALAMGGISITALFFRITYDDVFLAFRYARNILSGYGFVYNPGEKFLGTPAPAFVVLLVAGKILLPWLSIPELGGLISGLALTGCAILVYLLFKEYGQFIGGALAALLTLFSPFVVMTLGGETPIYLLSICAACYAYARGRYNLSAFLLGLASLNRSEGIVAAAVLFGHFLLTQHRLPVVPLLVLGVTLAPWIIFATIQFGSPLTHSLQAKIAQREIGLSPFIPTAAHWVWRVVLRNNPWALTYVPLSALGGVIVIREWRRWGAIFGWIIAQSAGYLILDVPFYHWYIAHLGVGLAVVTGLGVSWAADLWLNDSREATHSVLSRRRRAKKVLRITGVMLLTSLACATVVFSVWSVCCYHWGQPNPANRLYVKTGQWLKDNTPPSSSVAYIEIGQIGYYSERRIVDLLGLVSPGVAKRLKQGNFLWAYQFYRPDYVLYNPLFGPWMHPVIEQLWFKTAYEVIGEINEPGYPFPLTIYRKKEEAVLPPPVEIDVAQLRFDELQKLSQGIQIGQTFTPFSSNLCGVEIAFATYGREVHVPIRFVLTNTRDPGSILVSYDISPSTIHDNTWVGVFFPPLAYSEGRSFYFYLETRQTSTAEALALWSSRGDAYHQGTIVLNGQPGSTDLAFKTYTCPSQDDQ